MALEHAGFGDTIHLPPLGGRIAEAKSRALLKTHALELIHLVLQAGERRPPHQVYGELVLHCLEGEVRLQIDAGERLLGAGQLVLLAAKAPFALQALKPSSLLMTVQLPADQPGSGSSTL
jgi:quercetin dioxygenase-like cupin family protein